MYILAFLATLAVLGALAAAAPLNFVANAAGSRTPLSFAILDCVGTGHAALALRADYRAHLSAVQRDIGFRSIRGHGIFDDDMSTFLNGATNSQLSRRGVCVHFPEQIRNALSQRSTSSPFWTST